MGKSILSPKQLKFLECIQQEESIIRRDYVDLYYILKSENFSIEKLILDAKAKFDWHIDPLTLASQFMRVKEFTDFPRMLVPFNVKSMEDFFLAEAKQLESKILV